MKKQILIFIFAVVATAVSAQGLTDALKYGTTDIIGTARYMSLGGSMGAIGGDPSAIIDNPAALGVYRSSEYSFTLSAVPSTTTATSSSAITSANDFSFNLNQMSYVYSYSNDKTSGIVANNFSFNYNRVKDFNRTVYVSADNQSSMTSMMADFTNGFYPSGVTESNGYVPFISVLGYEGFMIDPMSSDSSQYTPYDYTSNRMAYKGIESGRIDEYSFSYSMNISHKVYIGATFGFQTLDYSFRSAYGEQFSTGAEMQLNNSFQTRGVGTKLSVGAIVRPTDFLRLGISYQSPTWYYSLKDTYSADIETTGASSATGYVYYSTSSAYSTYAYNTPQKVQASAAIMFGKSGFLNFDYEYADYSSMKYVSKDSNTDIFATSAYQYENSQISDYALSTHTFKLGAEVRMASQYSLRAGAAYRTSNSGSITRSLMDNTTRTDMEYFVDKGMFYGSLGVGYRYNGFGLDLAYAYTQQNQEYYPFQQDAEILGNGYFGVADSNATYSAVADIATIKHNIVMTLSYKF